jgi:FkbM family methyltransferase
MNPFLIELHDNEYISDYIRANGCWEPITTEILKELFEVRQPNTVFVDIGANIGYFTLLASQKGVPTIAFEPVAANYALLDKSIAKNCFENLTQIYMIPLSDKTERVTINVSNKNMGLCSTRKLFDEDFSYSQTSTAEPLDKYFGINTQNNLIVKIDVEEQEKKVLRGMEQTLASGKVTHIIIEIARHDAEIFDILRKHGFNYCTELGYTDGIRFHVIPYTQYLRNKNYLGTTDLIEKKMKESTNKNTQKILLFYKTPSPV